MNQQLMWQPSVQRIENAKITKFSDQYGPFERYADLHQWSLDQPEAFWSALWDFCEIIGDKGAAPYVNVAEQMHHTKFFNDATLNYAENLLMGDVNPRATAIIEITEAGDRQNISWHELRNRVAMVQHYLRVNGVGKGDVVAGWLPNNATAIIAMLAATSLGAVWTSCSPDFGVEGLVERFEQVEPKVLFATTGYLYNGKSFDLNDKLMEVRKRLVSLKQVVVDEFVFANGHASAELFSNIIADKAEVDLSFTRVAFNDPLFVLYSSGTTGKPKCIEHSVGGALLQHKKEHILHSDLGPESILFFYTTCGWMMWNWKVSALASGSTLVCYDGSVFYDGPQTIFALVDALEVTHFGTSAKYLAALEKSDFRPRELYHLSHLQTIFSTGSPLLPEGFDYVYESIKQDVCLSSIIGGTDLLGCFACGHPAREVIRGQIQCLALGMGTNVFDDNGQPLKEQRGELVCTHPFPSMPTRFVGDVSGVRYFNAYFDRFENIWAHGDFAEITEANGLIIYGRSDALLNPGGVRIGTAEIYREVEKFKEVVESVCIGQRWQDDTRVILFVKLDEGMSLDDDLVLRIKQQIKIGNTPRHVPALILQVNDIPRTLSGKITEVAVRQVVHGETVKNTEALANPESLTEFAERPELMEVEHS